MVDSLSSTGSEAISLVQQNLSPIEHNLKQKLIGFLTMELNKVNSRFNLLKEALFMMRLSTTPVPGFSQLTPLFPRTWPNQSVMMLIPESKL